MDSFHRKKEFGTKNADRPFIGVKQAFFAFSRIKNLNKVFFTVSKDRKIEKERKKERQRKKQILSPNFPLDFK